MNEPDLPSRWDYLASRVLLATILGLYVWAFVRGV
jgi:hypothetical protein